MSPVEFVFKAKYTYSMLPRCLILFFASILATPGIAQSVPGSSPQQAIQTALRAGDFAQALQLTGPQLQQSPRDAKLWTLQGIAFSGLGKDKEALEAYDKALSISPDYLPALEGSAELEYKTGSTRAIPRLNRILKQRPNDPTSHAMLAALSYKEHDCATAVKHFALSAELIKAQPAALGEYSACLVDLQRSEEAIPVLEQITALLPDDPRQRYDLAVAQVNAHHDKDAVDTLQPLLAATELDPDTLDLAASAYEDQGDTPKAVSLLRQAILTNPKKIEYYLDFATLSFNHQSFDVGIDMMNVGIKQAPNEARLYVARGILYIQLAQYEEGEADFQTAMRLDPRQASGAVAQGMAQIQQSNLDLALATTNSQLTSHPQDAFLHYMKAQILVQKGAATGSTEFKEAIAAATRATQLNPDFVLARDVLGNLYLKSGQLNLAVEQCRLALRGNPSDQEAIYHLVQALRQSGKGSKAEMAELVKRLADLRRESREQEASANKYKLYESAPAKNKEAAPPPQ
ncbi:MAG: tetratricopeptide repeat protein [Candidatus Sulfotelmatobacter sp.]